MDNRLMITNLEAELKLLRWHKLANESALKATILKNKQIRTNDNVPQLLNVNNPRCLLSAVVEDERSKDLIVRKSGVVVAMMFRKHTLLQSRFSPNRLMKHLSKSKGSMSSRKKKQQEDNC